MWTGAVSGTHTHTHTHSLTHHSLTVSGTTKGEMKRRHQTRHQWGDEAYYSPLIKGESVTLTQHSLFTHHSLHTEVRAGPFNLYRNHKLVPVLMQMNN